MLAAIGDSATGGVCTGPVGVHPLIGREDVAGRPVALSAPHV